MGVENIEKYSRSYAFLKKLFAFWHDKVFYRKAVYIGREALPQDEHLIFTPNHQNALMDALAVEFSMSNQFVFLARSDIFQKKFIAEILYFLKILPVYRIRDGYESLKKNELIFRKTIDIIRNKNGFVILPEGNHAGYRRLRSLKKGFARIAFQTEESENYRLNMKIVPVGIYYSDYEHFRGDLLVIFGKPFPVSDYYEIYRKSPAQAYNKIKDRLAVELKKVMVHIDSVHYETVDFLRVAYRDAACRQLGLNPEGLYDRFKAEKEIIARVERFEKSHPEKMEQLARQAGEYLSLLKSLKLKDVKQVSFGGFLLISVVLILAFPLFVYGYVNHFFPWNLSLLVASRIKDSQFRSSFKFVVSLFAFPLFYLLQTLAVQVVFKNFWVTGLYFLSLPLSAAVAWQYARLFRKTVSAWRYLAAKVRKDLRLQKAQALYGQIMQTTSEIFNEE